MFSLSSQSKACFALFGFVGGMWLAIGEASAQETDGAPPQEKLYEFSDIFLDVPKRRELKRTEDGAVIAPVAISNVNWNEAYRRMHRDSKEVQDLQMSAPRDARTLPMDEAGFLQFVRDVREVKPALRSIDRPRLPVLLPADRDMLRVYRSISPGVSDRLEVSGDMVLFEGFDDHYAATFDLSGVSLLINGSRLLTRSSTNVDVADRSRRMKDGTRFQPLERDDVGVSCAFERFGAVYTLEVVCDNPLIDARCSEDAFIMDIYEKLLLFGGNPR